MCIFEQNIHIMENLIKCTKCNLEKIQSEFYKDKQKSTGYRPDCKDCNKKKCSEWAKNNKERRKYYVLKSSKGLTREQYDQLLKEQKNVCAICNSKLSKRLSVDHCHKTNLVRGLLCGKCNFGLGYFNDDPELLKKAIFYLSNNASYKQIKCKVK
jgi:hypothetical protein